MANEPEIKSPEASPTTRLKEIAGYEIIGKLGQGGMGAVFKARQKSLDRVVALKVLPPKIAKDAKFIERFQREARASAKLNHPNIVQGIDVGQDPATGLWYFAMEYVDGPSLKKLLEEQKVIPEERALAIVRDVAKALETIGQNHMVHRDIKPDNILITTHNETKLADMGLAKQMDEDASLTQSGQAVGTPHYMSPEQVRGKFEECDIRTDIYSLGATLFHLVTGKPPFTGATSALIMSMHLTEAPPKANKVNPEVSEGCSRLIEKMMQKKIEQRVQTPADLIQQIDRILSGEQTGSQRPVAKTTGPRPPVGANRRETEPVKSKSNPTLMLAGIAAVVVVVIAIVLMKGGGKTPVAENSNSNPAAGNNTNQERTRNETKTPAGNPNSGNAAVKNPPPKTPTVSPDELYRTAQDFEQKNPESFDEITQRYQRAAAAAKGSPQEAELQDKVDDALEALKTRQRAAAETAFKAAEQKAAAAAGSGNYDDALNAYESIPAKLAVLVKDKSEEKVKLLHQEAEEKISAATKKAETHATDAEPAEGLKALAEVEDIAYAPMRGMVLALKKRLTEDLANEADLKKKKAEIAALKRLFEVVKKFDDALIETRDLKAAAEVAAEAKRDPTLQPLEKFVSAMNDVMNAYGEIAKLEQDALQKQIGQKVELETVTGLMKGTVAKIQEGIITLRIDFGGGASGEKKVKVADLSEAQRKKLFPPFVPDTDAQRIAQCYTSLSKTSFDFTAAMEMIVLAPDFPLTPHCRDMANKFRAERELAKAEAAAPAAWAEIHMKGNQAKLSDADAKVLAEKIAKFEMEYGKTQFAGSVKDKLAAIKARISSAASPNLAVNGDFEKGSIEGWETKGGSRVAEISSVQFHGGKHSLQATVPPDYYVSLTQQIAVEPGAEYKLSCWIKHVSGALEMTHRSGVYLIESDTDRRDAEMPSVQIANFAKLGEWTRMETKFTPKSASVKLDVFLRNRSRATEKFVMLVDDIEFSKVSGDSKKVALAPAPVPEILKALGLVFWVAPNGDPAGTSRELLSNTMATDKGLISIVADSGLKAMQFENSYVSYPAAPNVKAVSASGSAFVWVKVDRLPQSFAGMLMRGDMSQNGHTDVSLFLKDKFMLWFNYPENTWPGVDGKTAFFSKRPLTPGKWMMLGATWDGKTVTIWFNGEKDNSYNSTATPLVRAFPEIVTLGCDPAGSPEYFNGLMLGAMIFNRALSEFEIKSLYAMSGIIGK